MKASYRVYLIQSLKDHSYYTGISTDVEKRLATHNKGKGAKYTRSRLPFILHVVSKKSYEVSDALKEERRIKKLTHIQKMSLTKDPDWIS